MGKVRYVARDIMKDMFGQDTWLATHLYIKTGKIESYEREREDTKWMVSTETKAFKLLAPSQTMTNTLRSCIHYRERGTSNKRKRETTMNTWMSVRECATTSSNGRPRVECGGRNHSAKEGRKGNPGMGKRLVRVGKWK
jgi:hypothetical protein